MDADRFRSIPASSARGRLHASEGGVIN